ncbi:PQQ-dependent sugar dehydrogenase [Streptomyces sp. NPDC047097]|uniref:PQQ-dependent sugar dehydrogenase n=1 Tax=Streptomyces sp. NPDC047097 TaxID=3155260 RepID=UPI00340E0F58
MAAPAHATTPTASPAAAPAPAAAEEFQQVTLAKGVAETGEPMTMAVLPDRSVLHTSRDGTLRLTDAAGSTKVSGKLDVYSHDEEGLQGVGVDPGFAANRQVFLYYAPKLTTPAGDAPGDGTAADFAPYDGVNRLSRFTLRTDGTLDPASEKKVLDVPASRGICCHVGGDIDFDAQGNLYLSTGDDSNPFASDGYTPIDERPSRNPAYDAQRSSGNTNDLRGKVLRIKVGADGSYTVPAGNLFAPGTARTRPEIYAMGFRNPFRMSVDRATGTVYLGDYGPDAGTASPSRGPAGQVEFNRITQAGNYGWPYCTGRNDAYTDWDFANGTAGATFDCDAPRNTSPRNTGLTALPPAQPAWIPYDGTSVPEFGGGSESPMGGPVYRYDPNNPSTVKFPQSYDGSFFAGEFGRRWIRRIAQGADGTVQSINAFPWTGTQVMDMAFGPDGALYVLDYGTGYFNGDENSALYRIEHLVDGRSPVAQAAADRTSGKAPLTVAFSSAGSTDPDGGALRHAWKFGDGATSTAANPSHTYTANGQYTAELTVTDPTNKTATASVRITVGNTAPTVTLELPVEGRIIDPGAAVPFRVTVSDPEDGAIDCSKVKVTFILGHDSHGHPQTSANGCSGTVQTIADGEHDPNANIFGVWDAEYTDKGANGQPALTTHDQNISQPSHRQGEHYGNASGVSVISKAAAHGGKTVGDIHSGDWVSFTPYALDDATRFTARVSSGGAGGTLEVRAGSATGTLLGTATVPVTGGWENFQDVSTALANRPAGTTTLHLVFKGGAGALFDVDDFHFTTGTGPGPGPRTGPVKGVNGMCLDVAGGATADGTQVQIWNCAGVPAQSWTTPGDSTLRALGKCLDVSGGNTADGTKVQLWTCNGTGAQTWTPQPDGTLRNPPSGKCLDAEGGTWNNGTRTHLWTCHTGPNQKWTLP